MKNLKTKEGRMDTIKTIEESFLTALRVEGFDVAEDAVCRVERNSIELGIAAIGDYKKKGFKMAFASDVLLYAANGDVVFGRKVNEINFGSSGCFAPDKRESYWRTIHAASILKNWKSATEIINSHCKMYAELENELEALE